MHTLLLDKYLRVRKNETKGYLLHLYNFLNAWNMVEKYYINKELVGLALCFRTDSEDFDNLPKNPSIGKNLFVIKIVVKDGFEKTSIPLKMLRNFLKKNPGVEKLYLEYHKDDHLKSFNVRREYVLEKA